MAQFRMSDQLPEPPDETLSEDTEWLTAPVQAGSAVAAPATPTSPDPNKPFSMSAQFPPQAMDAEDQAKMQWGWQNIDGLRDFASGWLRTKATGAIGETKFVLGDEEAEANAPKAAQERAAGNRRKAASANRRADELDKMRDSPSTVLISEDSFIGRNISGEITARDFMTGLGSTAGAIVNPFTMYGESYEELRKGGLSDTDARKGAMIAGTVNSALELVGLGAAANLTGVGAIAKRGVRHATNAQMVKMLGGIASRKARAAGIVALGYGEAIGGEGITEGLQTMVNNAAVILGDTADDSLNLEGLKKFTAGAGNAATLGSMTGGGIRMAKTPGDIKKIVDAAHKDGEISAEAKQDFDDIINNVSFLQDERGSVSLQGIEDTIRTLADRDTLDAVRDELLAGTQEVGQTAAGGWNTLTDLANNWHEPLVQELENDQSSTTNQGLGKQIRRAIDIQREIKGRLAPGVRRIQNALGFGKKGRAMHRELSEIFWDEGNNFGDSKLIAAVENDSSFGELSGDAQGVVMEYRALSEQIAQEARDQGLTIELNDGTKAPFQGVEGGRRLSRHYTRDFYDIIQAGGVEVNALSEEIANRNGWDTDFALARLQALVSLTATREIGVEKARQIPNMPSHMMVHGSPTELVSSTPFQAAQAMLGQSQTGRLGMTAVFGQDPELLATLQTAAGVEGGTNAQRRALDTIRSMHGLPLKETLEGDAEINGNRGKFMKAVNAGMSLFSSSALSLSAILNIFEPLATIPSLVGWGNYIKGFRELAADVRAKGGLFKGGRVVDSVDPMKALALNNSIQADIINWNWDPGEGLKNVTRLARNVFVEISAGRINDNNELQNAYGGLKWVEQMQNGNIDLGDRMKLEFLKFDDEQISAIEDGTVQRGDQLWNDIVARATETGQATTSVPAERSRAANSRLWGAFVKFDSYPQKQFNRFMRVMSSFMQESKNLAANSNDPIARKRWLISSGRVASFAGGNALAGSLSIIVRATVVGGFEEGKDKINLATDHPMKFAWEALRFSALGGVADTVYTSIFGGGYGGSLTDSLFFPVGIVKEMGSVLKGDDKYEHAGPAERAYEFAKKFNPALRGASQWAAIVGLGNDTSTKGGVQMGTARKIYYNWMSNNVGLMSGEMGDPKFHTDYTRSHQEFSSHMKRAYTLMRKGGDPAKVMDEMRKAGISNPDGNQSQSLKSRKTLNRIPKELRAKFAQDISPAVLKQLAYHDSLLDAYANSSIPTVVE